MSRMFIAILCFSALWHSSFCQTSSSSQSVSAVEDTILGLSKAKLDLYDFNSNFSRASNFSQVEGIFNLEFEPTVFDSTTPNTLPYRQKTHLKSTRNLGFDDPDFQKQFKNNLKKANWVDGIDERQTLRNQGFVVPDGNGVEFQLNKKDK